MKHCVDDTASFAVFMTYSLKKAGKLILKVSGAWLTPAQPLYWSIILLILVEPFTHGSISKVWLLSQVSCEFRCLQMKFTQA